MLDQRHPGFLAITGDDIDDTGGKTGLLHQPDEFQRGRRSELGRLDDHGVAGSQSGRKFPGGQHQRRIPRRDCHHHAERLVARKVEITFLVKRDDRALDLVRQPAEIVVPLRNVIELARHLGDQLAVVAHFDLGKMLCVLRHQITEFPQQRAALRRRHLWPGAIGECSVRRTHRMIRIGRVAARNQRPRLAGKGVEALEPFARRGSNPFAADIHLVLLHEISLMGTRREARGTRPEIETFLTSI